MNRRQYITPITLCAALLFGMCFPATATARPDDEEAAPADPRWLERLDKLDRALFNELLGHAPPAIPDNLDLVGSESVSWANLRDKVLLIQSWSSKTMAGRKTPDRMKKIAADIDDEDLQIILLHTPDGADAASRFLERKPAEFPVLIDSKGGFCDALGVYKRPVNILVDRNGAVRYAGLNKRGLPLAVAKLLAEPFDSSSEPRPRPEPDVKNAIEYPPITGTVADAMDIRGQRAPDFYVDDWITDKPNAAGKVVIIEFWETRCAACKRAMPRLNDLAAKFEDKLVIVGVSEEDKRRVRSYVRDARIGYSIAIDPREKMSKRVKNKVIPHCLVIGADWIVRWQGNPQSLRAETVEQIILADEDVRRRAQTVHLYRNRWIGEG